MTEKDKLVILIKVADFLDRAGEKDLATNVDELLKEEFESGRDLEVEIPEEEYQILREIYEALGKSF